MRTSSFRSAAESLWQAATKARFRSVTSGLIELAAIGSLIVGVGMLAGDGWRLVTAGIAGLVYSTGLDK